MLESASGVTGKKNSSNVPAAVAVNATTIGHGASLNPLPRRLRLGGSRKNARKTIGS
jgi:hypothetical protein